MSKFLEALHLSEPASLKRFLVFVVSAVMVIITPFLTRWGLPTPDDAQVAAFVGLVAAFLVQSGVKSMAEAKAKGEAAAAAVDTVAKADAVITEAAKTEAK